MSTVTTRPSFVIFKDEPVNSPVKIKASANSQPTTAPTATVLTVVTAKNKENLHPTTGRRPGGEETANSKRKSGGVLTTKLLKVSSKAVSEPRPVPRKRKLSSSADKNHAAREDTEVKKKKPVATSAVSRRHKPKPPTRVRKVTELPKVEEEVGSEGEDEKSSLQARTRKSQAAVDSKCYDLTVLPLADVSTAFESALSPEEEPVKGSEDAEVAKSKDDGEAEQPKEEPTAVACETPITKTPTHLKVGIFSTPERKRLYSVFTFATPSPTSKRYASSRASSVDRFSDYDFDPLTDAITFRTL